MKLVVDASVAVAWVAGDEVSPYAEAAREALSSDAYVVPALWHWEIANAFLVAERRERCDDARALYERLLTKTLVETKAGDVFVRGSEISLARRHHLSVYDAAYLAVAVDERLPLATVDRKLADAARAEGCYFDPTVMG